MEKKVVKGDIFIIPNTIGVHQYSNFDKKKIYALLGIEVEDSEVSLQIWVTSPGNYNSNWGCRFGEFQELAGVRDFPNIGLGEEERCLGYFPSCIPARIIKSLKEGETIRFNSPEYGVDIELTANQLAYRYRQFGTFQSAMKSVAVL